MAFDRAALEEALPAYAREWLERECVLLGAPVRSWPRIKRIRVCVELAAVEAEADRIQEGGSRAEAIRQACSRLGIAEKTHETRLLRALREAFDPERDP